MGDDARLMRAFLRSITCFFRMSIVGENTVLFIVMGVVPLSWPGIVRSAVDVVLVLLSLDIDFLPDAIVKFWSDVNVCD